MARRDLSRRLPSRPASVALALSILCSLILSGSLPAASARHATKKQQAESVPASAPVPAQAPEAPAATAPSSAPATKHPHRHAADHTGSPSAPATGGQPAATPEGSAKPSKHDAATRAAERREQRRAERTAEQASGEGRASTGSGSGAGAQAVAGSKSRTRREREREERRREREHRSEGHETKKQREAREAREREASGTPGPVPVVLATPAAVSSTTVAVGAPAAGSPPKILSEQAARSTGIRGATPVHSSPRPTTAAAPNARAITATQAPRTPSTAKAKAPARRVTPSRTTKSAGSQIVTTVTKIIGVVPPLLWLLVGGLGLLAGAFALASRLSARRARVLARQREALLEDVGLLQAALLPELPERLGTLATTADYRPASGPAAGGDFYDVFALPDGQVAVIVGDVSGHGREALPHTTLLRFTLRAYMEAGLPPREALRTAAPVLERQLGGSFATVVLAAYHPRERTLTYACAGHPHPLLTGLAADASITACSAPPIGASRITGTRQTVVRIPGETVVCFYTDGVIEARVGEELFGVQRLSGSLEAIAQTATAAELLDRVSAQTDRRPDDMAACLLRIEGPVSPPSIRLEELEVDAHELSRGRVRRFLAAAGLEEDEIARTLDCARRLVAEHGNAVLNINLGEGHPEVAINQANVAPFRVRAIPRPQEVAR